MATTIGVWIGDGDERLVDEFDDTFSPAGETWSRSKEIKRAMQLAITVEETLDAAGYDFDSERSKRHFVRQALRSEIAREARDATGD